VSDTVQAALVSGVFLVLVAIVSLVPQLVRQHRDVREIRDQVSNSHKTNMRDDIDLLHRSVTWGFQAVHHRLDNVQSDIDVEKEARLQLARELADRLEKQ
jgi:hypothetical protein